MKESKSFRMNLEEIIESIKVVIIARWRWGRTR
jgi:hypothetical protein